MLVIHMLVVTKLKTASLAPRFGQLSLILALSLAVSSLTESTLAQSRADIKIGSEFQPADSCQTVIDFEGSTIGTFPRDLVAIEGNMLVQEEGDNKGLTCFLSRSGIGGTAQLLLPRLSSSIKRLTIELEIEAPYPAEKSNSRMEFPFSMQVGIGDTQSVMVRLNEFVLRFDPRVSCGFDNLAWAAVKSNQMTSSALPQGFFKNGHFTLQVMIGSRELKMYIDGIQLVNLPLVVSPFESQQLLGIRVGNGGMFSREVTLDNIRICSSSESGESDKKSVEAPYSSSSSYQLEIDQTPVGSFPENAEFLKGVAQVVDLNGQHWLGFGSAEMSVAAPFELSGGYTISFDFIPSPTGNAGSLSISQLCPAPSTQSPIKKPCKCSFGWGQLLGRGKPKSYVHILPGIDKPIEHTATAGSVWHCRIEYNSIGVKLFVNEEEIASAVLCGVEKPCSKLMVSSTGGAIRQFMIVTQTQ